MRERTLKLAVLLNVLILVFSMFAGGMLARGDTGITEGIDILTRVCIVVVPEEHHTVIKEDPDDDMVLDCALDVKAEYIVTGDHHLLDLKEFKGVRIVDSATFENILEK